MVQKNTIVGTKMKETKGERSYKYDVLHELVHAVVGWSCCREHMEWEVHGGTKVLAYLLEVDIGDAEDRMVGYAKISSKESCGRYKGKKK